jgi:uncharacterized membrane protein YjjP (DUF1212 family)
MRDWIQKSLGIAFIAFVVGYIGFNILCVVTYAFSKPPTTPVPSLVVGVPVAFIVAGIAFIFSAVRNSN